MPTAHSPTTKSASSPVKDLGEGVAVTSAAGGTPRKDDMALESAGGARRFRPPMSLLALAGAAVALAYGHFALAMRFGPPLVMVALGGMTLALCAAALWRVIDPLTRDETAVIQAVRAPQRLRDLEREKQAVLKAIKEIELDHQMRKISDADYREMVERYRARALRVMGDLAAGDDYRILIERELKARLAARAAAPTGAAAAAETSAKTAAPAFPAAQPTGASDTGEPPASAAGNLNAIAPTCAACGTPNDGDAQFCKKCGSKIVRSAEPG